MKKLKRKLKKKFDGAKLNSVLRNCKSFSPIYSDENADIAIITQLYAKAIYMGIAAIYSLLVRLNRPTYIEILDDGSLKDKHYELLKKIFPNVHIRKISEVNLRGCPQGGTWERLVRIQELTEAYYVIQIDSDALVINDIEEVMHCIEENSAFISSSPDWARPVSIEEIVDFASRSDNQNIQYESERQLKKISEPELSRYVRGCSAFTGFSKGENLLDKLVIFSKEMERKLGDRWHEWGTEQFSCNVLIGLSSNLVVLPWPKYQNFCFPVCEEVAKSPPELANISVLHFIGSNRFNYGVYTHVAREFVRSNTSL